MLRNYLKTAWRSFKRDRQFTLLNFIGLFTGLTCTLLIWLWVHDERSVDKFNKNDDRVFQVLQNWNDGKSISTNDATQGLLASSLRSDFPEIEYASSVIPPSWFDDRGILTFGNKHLKAAAQFAGKEYFSIFSLPIVSGDRNSFGDKQVIFLSEEMAQKLFGRTEVVNQTIAWNEKGYSGLYKVGAVFENPPANSTLKFDVLFSYDLFLEANPKLQKWTNNDPSTFIMLKKGVDARKFNQKIAGFVKSKSEASKSELLLQKFSDRYLYNHYENGQPAGGKIEYVRLFSLIAIFILVIACINFMNLATARASRRMKEVGIKKILGATRTSLIGQHLSESILMSFGAMAFAVLAAMILLPSFNTLLGKEMSFQINLDTIIAAVSIALLTGVLAGSYPAIYLTNFNSVSILKGMWAGGISESWIRKSLVVCQFALSALFIVAVLVVYKQMEFVQNKNIGYQRDHVIYFEKGGIASENAEDYKPGGKYESGLMSFIEDIKKVPGVQHAANFRHNIVDRNGGTSDLSWEGKDPSAHIDFTDIAAGYGFVETLGIEMKEGRSFSTSYPGEKSKIVFNEAAIKVMGLKNPVGKIVHLWGEDRQIIGVMKDFNFQSLHENLKPCFLDLLVNQRASKILVRLSAGSEKETIRGLTDLYQQYNPGFSFDYRFLDRDFQALYASENRVASMAKYFAAMAIIISALGLFGLAAFTAQRRKKEMGIRKVIGARAHQLAILMGKEYLKPVLFALCIAFPTAWLVMNQWLNGFAYRIRLEPTLFIIAAGAVMGISLMTVSFQSIKTAYVDPAETLRTE